LRPDKIKKYGTKTFHPQRNPRFFTSRNGETQLYFRYYQRSFQVYGFQPIETPAMENLSTLMGKYGEEGDKLLFKILNSGDFISNVSDELLTEKNSNKLTSKISEKGLRYDLTVPTARFVVQYQNEITFPFKRYQIQPVWRADRPQKGRYREFYQCDVDVIGSNSLLNEVELVQIIDDVFTRLKIKTVVKINNRKILSGIAEVIGENSRIVDITVAIDKLDKIGLEKVNAELLKKVFLLKQSKTATHLALKGSTAEKVAQLEQILLNSEIGLKGIAEIKKLFGYLDNLQLNTGFELDLTLARGLNYYTGAIFEVKARDFEMGSICGGGRYDDLTGIFGLPNVSGVGVSFGAERIYDVLLQANLFPQHSTETTKVLFVNFGEKEEAYCLPVLAEIRKNSINAEIFPDNAKMQKQMTYANKKNIPFVVLAGESEMQSKKFTLKNMETGEQKSVSAEELINILSQS
jgi:histidyl-tRNA synthetase